MPRSLPPCQRYNRIGLALLATALVLGACASSPGPALSWVRLPVEAASASAPAAARVQGVWQLMTPVLLPGHLDRDVLFVPQGAAGLQPLGGARWAEPLRDAVPRLLRQDLAREFGVPVWVAPLPPGVSPTRQLRVEFGAFDVAADGRSVELFARWSLADPKGAAPPAVFDAAFESAATGASASELAAAHRQALAELARRIADSAAGR